MIADIANGHIGYKETTLYARSAGVMLGAARVGSMVGFSKDLLAGDEPPVDEAILLQREEELTAELEKVREQRGC